MPKFGNAVGIRDFARHGGTDVCGYGHDGDLLGINLSLPALFPR
jgi:hypothetical protein